MTENIAIKITELFTALEASPEDLVRVDREAEDLLQTMAWEHRTDELVREKADMLLDVLRSTADPEVSLDVSLAADSLEEEMMGWGIVC